MGIIKHLSTLEIQKIAAGQVVERPANVVKELVENSLDAGATTIKIYIQQGGHSLIQVIDNGCGMEEDDARACFDNHATSKIVTVDDLTHLTTFGFRGEALASIAAVSNVTLTTRTEKNPLGIVLSLSQGIVQNVSPNAMSVGTDIVVRDIFFNVPARRKFLKKEETEWRAIVQLFQAFCLSYLNVHFQLFSNGTLIYNCPSVSSLKNRMVQIVEDPAIANLFSVEKAEDQKTIMSGVLSGPHLSRYNKNNFFFIVNRRTIKNYQLMNAVMKGYNNVLPEGRYPLGALVIDIDPMLIDINVDPRKEEIRFMHPRRLEQFITTMVTRTLEKKVDFSPSFSESPPQNFSLSKTFSSVSSPLSKTSSFFLEDQQLNPSPLLLSSVLDTPLYSETSEITQKPSFSHQEKLENPFLEQQTLHQEIDVQEWCLIGIVHHTYLVVQEQNGITLIDQHAAHERILFEQFSNRFGSPETINLLFPIIIPINRSQKEFIAIIQPILNNHGIDIELLSEHEVVVRAVPAYLKHICFKDFIYHALSAAQEEERVEIDRYSETLNKKLQAMMACKTAVKAGDILTKEHAEQLVRDLYKTANSFSCPHGRPTTWTLTLNELEKKFKRRV